ncbi:hypothetical protein [Marinimicrobium sp. C2-29]|uniref:hypothetical protein n=1 Tax=Marinimicrobium sp. C2-29 TaxID=3139825 RepID=UPI003138B2F6
MEKSVLILLFSVWLVLTGCGGGGGGDDADANPSPSPEPEEPIPDPVTPEPDLSGELPDAVLALPAVQEFRPNQALPEYPMPPEEYPRIEHEGLYDQIVATFYVMEAVYGTGWDLGVHRAPPILTDNPESPARFRFDNTECQSGSVEVNEVEHQTSLYFVATYQDCLTDQGLSVHGQTFIELAFDQYDNLLFIYVTYRDMNISDSARHVIYDGQVNINGLMMIASDFSVFNARRNQIYHAHEVIIRDGVAEGTLGVPGQGRFDFSAGSVDPGVLISDREHGTNVNAIYRKAIDEFAINYFVSGLDSSLEGDTSVPQSMLYNRHTLGNTAPELSLSGEPTLEIDQTGTVEALASDAEHDLLLFNWELLDYPEECEPRLIRDNYRRVRFRPDCRGNYTLGLTVQDAHTSVSQTFEFDVLPPHPELASHQINAGDSGAPLQAQVTLLRPETDGPFTYQLTDAPAGLQIDADGLITGTPERLFPGGGMVAVGVEVTNRRSTRGEVELNISSDEPVLSVRSHTASADQWRRTWGDINANGAPDTLVRWGNTFAIMEVSGTDLVYRYIETREFSPTGLLDLGLADADNNGENDIVLIYQDRIVALAVNTHEIKRDLPLPDIDLAGPLMESAFLFPGSDPSVTFEYSWQYGLGWIRYHLQDGSQYPVSDPHIDPGYEYHDVAGEGEPGIFTPNSVIHHGPALRYADGREVAYPSGNVQMTDVDGDGRADLLVIQGLVSEAGEIGFTQHDGETAEPLADYRVALHEALLDQHLLMPTFLQLDDQPEAEIVFLSEGPEAALHLYTLEDNNTYRHAKTLALPESYAVDTRFLQLGQKSGAFILNPLSGEMLAFSLTSEARHITSDLGDYALSPSHRTVFPTSVDDSGGMEWLYSEGPATYVLSMDENHQVTERRLLEDVPAIDSDGLVSRFKHSLQPEADEALLYATSGRSNGLAVIDPATGVVMAQTDDVPVRQWTTGDLDEDGLSEGYGVHGGRLYRLNPDYSIEILSQVDQSQDLYTQAPLVLDWPGQPTLAALKEIPNSGYYPGQLRLYQQIDGQLEPVASVDYAFDNPGHQLAQQDITGDGVPEVIVWQSAVTSGFQAVIYDQELQKIASVATRDDPMILPSSQARSDYLLGVARSVEFSKSSGTRLVWVDPEPGRVIEKSEYMAGDLIPDGFHCLGDNLQTCAKIVITDEGIYTIPEFAPPLLK